MRKHSIIWNTPWSTYRQTFISSYHTTTLLIEVYVLFDLYGGQAPGSLNHVSRQQRLLLPCKLKNKFKKAQKTKQNWINLKRQLGIVRLPSLPTIYKLYIILYDVSLCNWLSVVRGFPCCNLLKHSCNYSSCLTSEYEFQNVSQDSLIKWRQNCFNYILQCMRENA